MIGYKRSIVIVFLIFILLFIASKSDIRYSTQQTPSTLEIIDTNPPSGGSSSGGGSGNPKTGEVSGDSISINNENISMLLNLLNGNIDNGKQVKYNLDLSRIGLEEFIVTNLVCNIYDKDGTTINTKKESLLITKSLKLEREQTIPINTKEGEHTLDCSLTYNNEEIHVNKNFYVYNDNEPIITTNNAFDLSFSILTILVLIVVIYIIILSVKKRKKKSVKRPRRMPKLHK